MKHPIEQMGEHLPSGTLLRVEDGLVCCPYCDDSVHVRVKSVHMANPAMVAVINAESTGAIGTYTNNHPTGYPGRYGVSVEIRCEDCGQTTSLHLHQHKGTTVLSSAVEETEGIWPDMEGDDE